MIGSGVLVMGWVASARLGWLGRENFTFLTFPNVIALFGGAGDGLGGIRPAGLAGRENFTFLTFSNIFARVWGVGDGLGEIDYGMLNAPIQG